MFINIYNNNINFLRLKMNINRILKTHTLGNIEA